jgi:hypothetical protein
MTERSASEGEGAKERLNMSAFQTILLNWLLQFESMRAVVSWQDRIVRLYRDQVYNKCSLTVMAERAA